jgi:cell division septum initiation protein DivIVA
MPDQSSAATEHAILQEITGPLEALPDDPLSVVEADFPSSLRGYERTSVDEYVRRTRQLVAELQATRSPEAAVRRALERVGEQISGILQRAHETAEQITAQSRSEAEDRLEQARVEAAQIAEAAEQRVRDLDADTDRIWLERQRIVADAEDLAAQLQGLATTAAERFPADPETPDPDAADAVPDNVAADGALDAEADDAPAAEDDAPAAEDDAPAAEDDAPAAEDDARVVEPEAVQAEAVEPAAVDTDGAEADDADAPGAGADPDDATLIYDDRSEIERTVAFQALAPDAEPEVAEPVDAEPVDAEPVDAEPEVAEAADSPPAEVDSPGRLSTEDDTAVIPPASQAANRRRRRSR